MSSSKSLALVLLSAGMDSAVCASIASLHHSLAFLHIQYGQRTAKKELECFHRLCEFYKPVMIFIAEAPFLKAMGGSSLTNENLPIPEEEEEGNIPSTYVPFRNGIFLSIATAWAEIIGAKKIFIGVNQIDFSGYPDCRESFIRAFNQAIQEGTKPETQIEIATPLINLSKREIVQLGVKLGTPFHLTWSCYKDNELACGKCSSCKIRLKAFNEAGVNDPLPYR
ncbi:MAG: 7-cyano-7-deazaguanine synthase QueC [Caldimicrobium sp.]